MGQGPGPIGFPRRRIDDPVRSRILKLRTGRSEVRWVTTSKYRLFYILLFVLTLFPIKYTPEDFLDGSTFRLWICPRDRQELV